MPDLQRARDRHLSDEGALTATDAELLRRSAAGERASFDGVIERHAAAVLHLARAILADADAAEDVLQETFLAAWRGAGGFRGDDARAWLLTIARNAARRHLRTRAGEPREHESTDQLALRAGWGAEDDDTLRRLAARELVERGLAGLSAEDREVLVLRDLNGLTGEEAAATLGISLPAQKSRLHRARLRFIAILREIEP